MKCVINGFSFFSLLILLTSCYKLPVGKYNKSSYTKVTGCLGPEDFVLDTFMKKERLFISSQQRRPNFKRPGEIFIFDLKTNRLSKLERRGEPEDFVLHPHGVDLLAKKSGQFLVVISHNEKQNIVVYQVLETSEKVPYLKWTTAITHKLIQSPNDLAVSDDGFYFSNDHLLFGNSCYCDFKGNCKKVATLLSYPNGVETRDSILYVSTTVGNSVWKYTIQSDNSVKYKKKIAKVKGADNFSFSDNALLVAAHPKKIAFLNHVNDATNLSPSEVYSINLKTGKKELVFADSGEKISGSATAIFYKGKLYISQVFEPFILVVNTDNLEN